MSLTKNLGRPLTRSKPSARGPTGFGTWNVWARSQLSCQRASIWAASAAVYPWRGLSPGAVMFGPCPLFADRRGWPTPRIYRNRPARLGGHPGINPRARYRDIDDTVRAAGASPRPRSRDRLEGPARGRGTRVRLRLVVTSPVHRPSDIDVAVEAREAVAPGLVERSAGPARGERYSLSGGPRGPDHGLTPIP